MAELSDSIDRVIKEALNLDLFKEEIRQLREQAWDQGYISAVEGKDGTVNPYQKEN